MFLANAPIQYRSIHLSDLVQSEQIKNDNQPYQHDSVTLTTSNAFHGGPIEVPLLLQSLLGYLDCQWCILENIVHSPCLCKPCALPDGRLYHAS